MRFFEEKYKPRLYLLSSLLLIGLVFIFTSVFIYKKFNTNLINNELSSQTRLAQIVDQLLTRYFYTIKFITQNTSIQPEFNAERTVSEDNLLYKKIPNNYAEEQIVKQKISAVLSTPRTPVLVTSGEGQKVLHSDPYNWQIFKALPLYNLNGKTVAKARRDRADSILKTYQDIYYVFQMKPNGDLIFLEPYSDQKNIKSFNYAFRDYLQLTENSRETSISEGYISSDEDETQIITVASPIFDNKNKLSSIFAASISARILRDSVFKELKKNISSNDGTIFYLIDRHGHVVASSNGRDIYFPIKGMKNDSGDRGNVRGLAIFSDFGWTNDFFEKGNMWEREVKSWNNKNITQIRQKNYLNLDGVNVIGTFYPTTLGGNKINWGILIETPMNQLVAEKNELRKVFFISGFFVSLILLTLFYFTIRNFGKLEKKIIQKEEELVKTATQVAHDIRSPLVALDALIPDLKNVEEGVRVNVQRSISRINDIANKLVIKYKNKKSGVTDQIESELIAILVDSLITEKKIEFQHKKIVFIKDFSDQSYGVFSEVNSTDLKRVVSNIINNSVDSIIGNGNITLKLITKLDSITLSIIDDGCGIEKDKVEKIMAGVYQSEKINGAGLGLSFAKEKISSWGGKIEIDSELHHGTTVSITLPKAKPAKWFKGRFQIKRGETVVIIDDDQSIHGVWENRLLSTTNDINLIHFYNPDEVIAWALGKDLSDMTFLVDYELLGYELNGVDIIEKLNIANRAILVTSHFEDDAIRDRCKKLNLKVIPKNYSLYIQIDIINTSPDFIVIDDNDLLLYTWLDKAKKQNISLVAFSSIEEFYYSINAFNKKTQIYIDSNLEGEIKGEDFAKILYDKFAYQNIYLSTAFKKDTFKEMYWIKSIVGKEPPF